MINEDELLGDIEMIKGWGGLNVYIRYDESISTTTSEDFDDKSVGFFTSKSSEQGNKFNFLKDLMDKQRRNSTLA